MEGDRAGLTWRSQQVDVQRLQWRCSKRHQTVVVMTDRIVCYVTNASLGFDDGPMTRELTHDRLSAERGNRTPTDLVNRLNRWALRQAG